MSFDAAYLLDGVAQGGSAGGLDQLTGDVTAGPGTGSQAATLANTAVTPAAYGSDVAVAGFTVDAKGRLTAAANIPITFPAGGITQLTGDVTAGPGTGSQAATIGANKVLTTNILDANVTLAKIANLAAARVLGSIAGTAPPAELTITQILDLVTGTPAAGDILYRDASTWLRLAAGASGTFLKSNGVAAPSWGTPTGTVLVATVTLTAAQIRTLNSAPVTVAAAGGANTVLMPIAAVYKNNQVDGFSANANVNIQIGTGNFDAFTAATAILNAGSDDVFVTSGNALARTFGTISQAINQPIVVKSSADVTSGNAANTIVVSVAYAIMPTA